ncbi:MAG: hypothetical protein WCX74_01895 [Candidatus Paceibacterota bacterium]
MRATVTDEIYGAIIHRLLLEPLPLAKLLLVRKAEGEMKEKWFLPGDLVYESDLTMVNNETWIGGFLSQKIESQTGISREVIAKKIQPMPAIYRAYLPGGHSMQSCLIIGEVYQEPRQTNAVFFSVEDIVGLAESEEFYGGLKGAHFRLCMRVIASRDWPVEESRLATATILRNLHH